MCYSCNKTASHEASGCYPFASGSNRCHNRQREPTTALAALEAYRQQELLVVEEQEPPIVPPSLPRSSFVVVEEAVVGEELIESAAANTIKLTTKAAPMLDPVHEDEGVDEHFVYHGQCDMFLTNDPKFANDLGIDLYIHTKLVIYWRYTQEVVIRIGSDLISFDGSSGNFHTDVNSWTYELQDGKDETMAGFPITFSKKKTKSHKTITIDLISRQPLLREIWDTLWREKRLLLKICSLSVGVS